MSSYGYGIRLHAAGARRAMMRFRGRDACVSVVVSLPGLLDLVCTSAASVAAARVCSLPLPVVFSRKCLVSEARLLVACGQRGISHCTINSGGSARWLCRDALHGLRSSIAHDHERSPGRLEWYTLRLPGCALACLTRTDPCSRCSTGRQRSFG